MEIESMAREAQMKLLAIEKACASAEGGGIAAVGACAAVRAMAQHWKDHFQEGFGWEIVGDDIAEAIKELGKIGAELSARGAQEVQGELVSAT